jgi:hypothetical protein
MLLASIDQFLIYALSFSVECPLAGCAVLYYHVPSPLFIMGISFGFMPFCFMPAFSGTHLGCK